MARAKCGKLTQRVFCVCALPTLGETIDEKLEEANFGHALQACSELWDGCERDGYSIKSTYTMEPCSHENDAGPTEAQRAAHVRFGSHTGLLVIVLLCRVPQFFSRQPAF